MVSLAKRCPLDYTKFNITCNFHHSSIFKQTELRIHTQENLAVSMFI